MSIYVNVALDLTNYHEYNEEKLLFCVITAYCKKVLNKYICAPSTIQIIENILPKSRIENDSDRR